MSAIVSKISYLRFIEVKFSVPFEQLPALECPLYRGHGHLAPFVVERGGLNLFGKISKRGPGNFSKIRGRLNFRGSQIFTYVNNVYAV